MSDPARRISLREERTLALAGYAAFFLCGWSIVLIPALIRGIQASFVIGDGAMGMGYLVDSGLYVVGSIAIGFAAARGRRRPALSSGPLLIATGLALCIVAPTWPTFVAGFGVFGAGCGVIDSGINALFMDLFRDGRARALSRLHLWLAVGAFISPAAAGRLAEAGFDWRVILAGTAVVAVAIGIALAVHRMPDGRRTAADHAADAAADARAGGARRGRLRVALYVPLALLALALGCYVATEIGLSNWLVRFLEAADLGLATTALSLFWGTLALGRLGSTIASQRIGPVPLAIGASIVCGAAIVLAVVIPVLPVRILLVGIAGLAAGPIYPMIMAIGGSIYPTRSNLVASSLSTAGVVGALVYPPLMGPIADAAGVPAAMLGAGLLSVLSAPLIAGAVVAGRRRSMGRTMRAVAGAE